MTARPAPPTRPAPPPPAPVVTELLVEVLARRGEARFVAHGGSMRGAIASGSLLAVRRLPRAAAVGPGDVVAARVAGTLLVHRVVGVDARGRFLLKGDACPTPDGWIGRADIVGLVTGLVDDDGARPVPPPTPLHRRPLWRRALGRLARLARAERAPSERGAR